MSLRSYLSRLNHHRTRIFPKFSTIIIVVLISLFSLTVFSLIKPSLAATTSTSNENIIYTQQKYMEEGNNSSYLASELTKSRLVILLNSLIGKVDMNPDGTIKTSWIPGGIIGTSNQFIAQLYVAPASGIQYLAEVKDNFLGIKVANAQGFGYSRLQPILPIWRNMRNAVYVISSFFFIIVGFMILLRVKISPQATVTLQNAIPPIITTLILVTFSYAIAGLIIDLSYVIQSMVILIIDPNLGNGWLNSFATVVRGLKGILSVASPGIASWIPDTPSLVNGIEPNIDTFRSLLIVPSITAASMSMVALSIIFAAFSAFSTAGAGMGTIIGGFGSLVICILLLLIVCFWMVRFLFGLLRCYATIIFKIVVGPLEIALGAFPNSNIGFGTWVLDLIANIAVFPISFIVLFLSNYIIYGITLTGFDPSNMLNQLTNMFTSAFQNGGSFSTSLGGFNLWIPSILDSAIPFIPNNMIASGAIGLSTLMLLSRLPEMIPQYIFMIKPSPWGTAIGEGLNATARAPGNIFATGAAGIDRWNTFNNFFNQNNQRPQRNPFSGRRNPVTGGGRGAGAGAGGGTGGSTGPVQSGTRTNPSATPSPPPTP